MAAASIDIGSNSMLLLVIDGEGNTLHDEAVVVGLGKGMGHRGLFRTDRMDAAIGVFQSFQQTAAGHGVAAEKIRAVATSASRRAMNGVSFFERVRVETGIGVEIISGLKEAELTWKGALLGLPITTGPMAVVDLGGGSTEFVVGDPETEVILMQQSLELGSVRLTEKYFGEAIDGYRPADLAHLRTFVADTVDSIHWEARPRAVVAVAGTATTLCAMELGLTVWDRNRVHGSRLGRAALRRWIDRLLGTTAEQRREWAAVSPERADYLLAGACVLESICNAAHRDSLWISDGGVRHGALLPR